MLAFNADVIANPMTKPKGAANIKNVSHADFLLSFANMSAQTGIYIVTKT